MVPTAGEGWGASVSLVLKARKVLIWALVGAIQSAKRVIVEVEGGGGKWICPWGRLGDAADARLPRGWRVLSRREGGGPNGPLRVKLAENGRDTASWTSLS
jgi:hypothetical protein